MTLSKAADALVRRNPKGTYNIPAPTVRADVADRIRAIEAAAPRPRAANARCCGKCKTPYNCGRPGCPCHHLAT